MLATLTHCFAALFPFTGFKTMDKWNFMMKKALLLAALTMLACSPAQTETPASGNIQTALSKLDPYIGDLMHETGIPSLAVAVVYQGRGVFMKGYGVRRLGDHRDKVDPDTVFEIASVSKPLASTIVASLVGTGEVSWDDRIEALDQEFKLSNHAASEQVTVRDLFSHRSGLPTGAGDIVEELG
jgi:CubicO group peptidase (beta-lactamase class C family)